MMWQAIVMWVTATHRELGPFVRENLDTIKGLDAFRRASRRNASQDRMLLTVDFVSRMVEYTNLYASPGTRGFTSVVL